MNIEDYKKLFDQIKAQEYKSLVEEFLQFAELYETKAKASENYNWKIRELVGKLKYSDLYKGQSIDSFKHTIILKVSIVFSNGLKEPIEYLLETHYTEIIEEFKKTKENEIRLKENPSFDYVYFDNFSKKNAVEFSAKIKALEDFKDYLFNIDKEPFNVNDDDSDNVEIVSPDVSETKQKLGTLDSNLNNHGMPQADEKKKKNSKPVNRISLDYNDNEAAIKILYHWLHYYDYIEVSEDEFKKHFKNNKFYNKIRWKKEDIELLYLFWYVKTVDKKPYKIIFTHFQNQYNESFNEDSFYSMTNQFAEYENIDEILLKLRKI